MTKQKIISVKTENKFWKTYQIGKRRLVELRIEFPSTLNNNKWKAKVNWGCMGSVSLEEANQFSQELQKAITIGLIERTRYDKTK